MVKYETKAEREQSQPVRHDNVSSSVWQSDAGRSSSLCFCWRDRKHRMYVGWMINITHRHHICCSVWSEKSIKCSEKAATFNTRVLFSIVKWIITCDTIWVLPLFLRCPDWDMRLTVRKWVGSFLVIWSCWKENVWCTHMLGKNHILLNEQ